CGPVDFSFNDVTTPGNCPQEFSVTRTWTAVDDCGNTSTASQTITVEDNTAPVISCPNDVDFSCESVGAFGEATAVDACDPDPSIDFSDDTVTTTCPLEIVRTWTATDACGNSSSCQQNIIINDETPPVISGVGGPQTIECPAEPVFSNPSASDNCGDPTLEYNDQTTPGACPQEYSVTRTWTATDACGNTATASQTITVVDNTAPVITGVGGPETIECPAEPVFSNPSATDACGPADLGYNDVTTPGACPQEYSITRTWTATDDCGNASTASQTITVVDNTAPVITGVGGPETIECPAEPQFSNPSATDACGPADLGYNDETTPGACPQEYSITRTWTATDDCGNASTASQTITVVDNTAPVISGVGGNETIECPSEPNFSNPSANDACGPVDFSFNDETTPGACPQEFSVTRTWTAVDECGNTSTASQTITVEDNTPPVISCPSDVDFSCESVGAYGEATAVDACDPNPSIVSSDDTVTTTCPLEIVRTWTATDACGNSSSCQQNIIIRDETPPVISGVGGPQTIECPAEPVFSNPSASDNCGDPTLEYSDQTTPGACPQEYSVTRTWTATDACGNTATASQAITVVDNTAPVITGVGGPQTIDCPAEPQFSTPSATDACGPASLSHSDQTTPGDCPQEYAVTRTWTAADSCGNTSTASQTITVVDNTPPVISGVGGNETLECPAEPNFSTPSATDACGPADLSYADDTTFGDCPAEYSITRTWTAADSCGNTSSATQTITVEDNTPPVIACAAADTIGCEDVLEFTPPTATDDCDSDPAIIMVGTDTAAGPNDGEFIYTRYWYAMDTCGNASDTCSQEIFRESCPREFCTYTMGGWGTDCPDSQADDMFSTQPGCIRDHYFDDVFPDGVTIGHPDYYTAHWTNSSKVRKYLPAGGTPGTLDDDYHNPTYTSAGVLAGQILALKLNVGFSEAGIPVLLGLLDGGGNYGAYVIDSCGGPFAGLTVNEFLAVADMAVGGNTAVLDGFGATLSDVNFTATCLNELHNNCRDDVVPFVAHPTDENLPIEFGLGQNYPNPFNPLTEISFALPNAARVTLEIFNIMGQKVATVVDGSFGAGHHSVTWNSGRNASGVYFYRLQADAFVDTKKMLLLK
ncbi:MAG: T9SS type A sorting domain-containing protein, partial [candidate division Zixibacteria bacterium]|nr:T9SS type A sorting domain-containing protein [candidate division Zixibacteria bacterium]